MIGGMDPKITIRHQHRRNLMMRAVRGGLEVYVPLWIKKDSPQVQRFVAEGVKKLADKVPPNLPQYSTRKELRAMVKRWAAVLEVQPGRITFRAMQRKWGSCSSRDNITLNSSLTGIPPQLAEYVILHELVHLRVFNHGKEFKALMREHMPDFRERERELDQCHP